ncbi:AAA-domain-containing protein [Trametopsis cervina]|nr:AAA-domain-containing protein [Trametopsis cervina]
MNRNGHTLLPPNSNLAPTPTGNNWDFSAAGYSIPETTGLTITLPPMANTRRSTRSHPESYASSSEYQASQASPNPEDDDLHGYDDDELQQPPAPVVLKTKTAKGRITNKVIYAESSEDHDDYDGDGDVDAEGDADADGQEQPDDLDILEQPIDPALGEEDEGEALPKRRLSKRRGPVIESDEDGEAKNVPRYSTRSRSKPTTTTTNGRPGGRITRGNSRKKASAQSMRRTRSSARDEQDDSYVAPAHLSSSGDESIDDVAESSGPEQANDLVVGDDADADAEGEPEGLDGRPYSLRQRNNKVNYAILPPIEELPAPPKRSKGKNGRGSHPKAPGWSASGAQLDRWLGGVGDDSDSDFPSRSPRKGLSGGFAPSGGIFAGGAGAGGLLPTDLAAGTPSNLGKVGEASLADADPLGVNQNVTFDEVGGLEDHINALKEMTLLPLLYPEVFQRFNLTPPRGVLFHGPPGTGKTLLARALAASSRSNGKGITFFMRKGADTLSKWVGEAERQLRLLFEEAKNCQPSIIFFDEIDGLAPVRSSKQDQIHASIVSTLLALMDGMDGRGQVVVIGATNRPDSIDPALRRPGRFDREFYFPLPNLDARERILRIMTRKWAGWEEDKGEENAKGLAKLTKGYGGADLRALCTEAALNAVQRRYPQIYKSTDRLLLQPETINVELRDFMIAVKKLVPSSARSAAPAASPLPEQLLPLLQESLDRIKTVINAVLPVSKKRTALEEAEWEDEGEEGALDREMMLQSMETLRVHRPRVVLHGSSGMGQAYIAAAALHHLEGFHAQTLDIANLMSDSTRTPEAAIVQLFVEAKRHQPSVVYIPSLGAWCAAVSETARTTLRAMLDSLAPTDPVLLLATVDGSFATLPRDVRAWFGPTKDNRVGLTKSRIDQRDRFFEPLIKDALRPPNQFPDGVPRKKRVLEELPIAPPLEPRAPSAAELAMQQEADLRTITLLKYRLGPVLTELKRKFKRFTKRAAEEYHYDFDAAVVEAAPVQQIETVTTTVEVQRDLNGDGQVVEVVGQEQIQIAIDDPMTGVVPATDGINEAPVQIQAQVQVQAQPQLFDMDLERMHLNLYRDRYLTPDEFLNDIRKIVHNASVRVEEDPERLFRAQAMLTAAEVSCQDFDSNFRLECERMAARESKRREDYRKTRAQNKAAEQELQRESSTAPPRRSTRNNGPPLDISITDPLKLERRLKRARSTEGTADPSEEENGEAHTSKRSRVSSSEAQPDGPVPMVQDIATPPALHMVRFADDVPDPQQREPSAPRENGFIQTPVITLNQDQAVDSQTTRSGGFDPSLLNPMSPDLPSTSAHVSFTAIPAPPHPEQLPGPFSHSPQPILQPIPQLYATTEDGRSHETPAFLQSLEQPSLPKPSGSQTEVEPTKEPIQELVHEEMEAIERIPTPLPDFHVDMDAISRLKEELQNSTEPLNVEELEQLRAMCLARVWKHRSSWDRTPLVEELRALLREFVEEVVGDGSEADSP